jgi:threonine dehydrogenase-like Zn-dependent dehydrogenase
VGSHASSNTFQESIRLLQNGAVQVEPLISHQLPVERFAEALHIAEALPERMKIQVLF